MSDLINRIRAAQVRAGEEAVIQHLREQGLAEKVEPDDSKVICPNCCCQFGAVPVSLQRSIREAGLTLVHSARGYEVIKLGGPIEAQ